MPISAMRATTSRARRGAFERMIARALAGRLQLPQCLERRGIDDHAVMQAPPQIEDKGIVAIRDLAEAADDSGGHTHAEWWPSGDGAGGIALCDARLAEQEALPEIDVQIQHFQQHRLGLDALDDEIDGVGI